MLDMKVHPSFYDEECAIVFSCSFVREAENIGQAVIYTCEESTELPTGECLEWLYERGSDPKEKIAYLREFTIADEYQETSLEKINQFLKIIGITKCVNEHELVC